MRDTSMRFRIVALRARIFYDLQSRDCAAGTRMPWHPVPRRAAWLGAVTCSLLIKLRLLISFVIYKETALGFDCLFWLHQ